jgi:hypothetical protein
VKLKFIEITNGPANWGKFAVATFTPEEWQQRAVIDGHSIIAGRGWTDRHVWVLDLQTGEGAMFRPGGSAKHDLDKHAIWVCPMYQPMLEWLYSRVGDAKDVAAAIAALPDHVDLPDAPFALSGYRRPGPGTVTPMDDTVAKLRDERDQLRAAVRRACDLGRTVLRNPSYVDSDDGRGGAQRLFDEIQSITSTITST